MAFSDFICTFADVLKNWGIEKGKFVEKNVV